MVLLGGIWERLPEMASVFKPAKRFFVLTPQVPLSLVSDLIETVEQCNWKLVMLEEELPRLKKTGEVK
jgi:hypothetical protein